MNIPNLLTLLRFIMIPVFLYFFFAQYKYGLELAVAIFILAGITDTLDGYIARKYNMITRLGIVLDPLADKLMLITVLVCVTIRYNVPLWIIAVVGLKELLMILGAISLYNQDDIVIPANIFGKISTFLSYIAILSVVFNLRYSNIILYSYVSTTILALTTYFSNFLTIKKQNQLNLIKK